MRRQRKNPADEEGVDCGKMLISTSWYLIMIPRGEIVLKTQVFDRRLADKMMQCMDSDHLYRRLKKIIGQVNAIDR